MYLIKKSIFRYLTSAVLVSLVTILMANPVFSKEYNALSGVNKVKAIFDVSMRSPIAAPLVFWAVRNVYEDKNVSTLPESPEVAIVFHGSAVKLISTNRDGYSEEEKKSLDKFAVMIRQMKQDGVKMEVCLYAAKVLGVDVKSLLPEIDHVGNGFISIVGYQAQGYSVVSVN